MSPFNQQTCAFELPGTSLERIVSSALCAERLGVLWALIPQRWSQTSAQHFYETLGLINSPLKTSLKTERLTNITAFRNIDDMFYCRPSERRVMPAEELQTRLMLQLEQIDIDNRLYFLHGLEDCLSSFHRQEIQQNPTLQATAQRLFAITPRVSKSPEKVDYLEVCRLLASLIGTLDANHANIHAAASLRTKGKRSIRTEGTAGDQDSNDLFF
ncbi:hypothetical protein [Limnobacter sp.]|uniref:hypothetical protein n=1 Tax=Limnobacter sp. TaxID=2003368 RepID=UPI003515FA5A